MWSKILFSWFLLVIEVPWDLRSEVPQSPMGHKKIAFALGSGFYRRENRHTGVFYWVRHSFITRISSCCVSLDVFREARWNYLISKSPSQVEVERKFILVLFVPVSLIKVFFIKFTLPSLSGASPDCISSHQECKSP